uniref:Cilia- and flagella-associated protein 418 n=1 Tax=Callorhinchus milii TaxID=7868 RepID=A0A4W3H8M7_CALMI
NASTSLLRVEKIRWNFCSQPLAIEHLSPDTSEGSSKEDDLSDMIEDIFHDDPIISNSSKPGPRTADSGGKRSSSQVQGRKCCPVYLGGSSAPLGIGTNISPRTCDQLRCTACDFKVVTIDDYEWDKSCDYLFFRNNMPDLNKLKGKLLKRRGGRAYACQCTWRSIQDLTDLKGDQQIRWVCGRH